MRTIVTAEQMQRADRHTIETLGVPQAVLMERAALGLAQEVEEFYDPSRVLVVCGPGNNGGDGAAAARILHTRGRRAELFLAGDPEKYSEGLSFQLGLAANYGVPEVKNPVFSEYTVIIDALFGVGLVRPLSGAFAEIADAVNASGVPVVAADLPSGIHSDTGAVLGTAVRASSTVTFEWEKCGLLLYPGAEYAGRVRVCKIGIVPEAFWEAGPACAAAEPADIKPLLSRSPRGSKGDFGRVLLVAGSKDMGGAAVLSARAALSGGAGMVKVFTERSNRTGLLASFPEAMYTVWEEGKKPPLAKLEQDIAWADAVVAGPGLGCTKDTKRLLAAVLALCDKPLILDADALNLLARFPELWDELHAPCAVTPHLGEMARLRGVSIPSIQKDPIGSALALARQRRVCVVQKDAVTVTAQATEKKETVCLQSPGCSALSTAGSGDVLAGLLGAFAAGMARRKETDLARAAAAAVWIHARAGRAAAARLSEACVTASELIRSFPEAFAL